MAAYKAVCPHVVAHFSRAKDAGIKLVDDEICPISGGELDQNVATAESNEGFRFLYARQHSGKELRGGRQTMLNEPRVALPNFPFIHSSNWQQVRNTIYGHSLCFSQLF